MKIGGFWGLTAPMLVILAKNIGTEKTKDMISTINKNVNSDIIDDLRTELVYLYNAADKFPRSFSSKMMPTNLVSKKTYLTIRKGKLVGLKPADNQEELLQDLYYEITVKVALDITKELYSGNQHFCLSAGDTIIQMRSNLFRYVKDYLQDKTFRLNNTWAICKDIVDSLRDDVSHFTDRVLLCGAFDIEVGFLSNINVNGVQYNFSDSDLSIIDYVLDQEVILEILNNLNIFKYNELLVFDTPFRELICRAPSSLLFLIINKFDLVKTKRHYSFLQNLVIELKHDLELFKQYFASEVICADKKVVKDIDILNTKRYKEIIQTYDNDKFLFFSEILANGYVKASDLKVEDLTTISNIYDYVILLNKDTLNSLFNVNYDDLEWDRLSRKFVEVGICGINLYSIELLKDSIRTTSFVSVTKFEKSKENIEAFYKIISDIEALLDTIKPIGEAL